MQPHFLVAALSGYASLHPLEGLRLCGLKLHDVQSSVGTFWVWGPNNKLHLRHIVHPKAECRNGSWGHPEASSSRRSSLQPAICHSSLSAILPRRYENHTGPATTERNPSFLMESAWDISTRSRYRTFVSCQRACDDSSR